MNAHVYSTNHRPAEPLYPGLFVSVWINYSCRTSNRKPIIFSGWKFSTIAFVTPSIVSGSISSPYFCCFKLTVAMGLPKTS